MFPALPDMHPIFFYNTRDETFTAGWEAFFAGTGPVPQDTLSGGVVFSMSSYLWALEDAEGNSIESGCKTDLPIERIESEAASAPDPRLTIGDYTPFFDDAALDRLISDWFARPAEVPAA